MMGYLIEDCRKGKQLSSAQLMEAMAEFNDAILSIDPIRAVCVVGGVPFFGSSPEKAIAAAADGSKTP